MSRKGLVHDIHREFQGFELRTRHDGWDHRILYVVDLDCDYAIPLLRAVRDVRFEAKSSEISRSISNDVASIRFAGKLERPVLSADEMAAASRWDDRWELDGARGSNVQEYGRLSR